MLKGLNAFNTGGVEGAFPRPTQCPHPLSREPQRHRQLPCAVCAAGAEPRTSGGYLRTFALAFTVLVLQTGYTAVVTTQLVVRSSDEVTSLEAAIRAGWRICVHSAVRGDLISKYPRLSGQLVPDATGAESDFDRLDRGICRAAIMSDEMHACVAQTRLRGSNPRIGAVRVRMGAAVPLLLAWCGSCLRRLMLRFEPACTAGGARVAPRTAPPRSVRPRRSPHCPWACRSRPNCVRRSHGSLRRSRARTRPTSRRPYATIPTCPSAALRPSRNATSPRNSLSWCVAVFRSLSAAGRGSG
jgi:hypothetical protein